MADHLRAEGHSASAEPLLDHFVYAVPDLVVGSAVVAQSLQLSPSIGGAHEHATTANTLVSLGSQQYLEILGPNPELPRGELRALGAYIAHMSEPDVLTFAMASRDLAAVARTAESLGLATSGLEANSRRTPAGDLLEWEGVHLVSAEYRGLVPFFIDWRASRHPSTTSVAGGELASLYATHPAPARLREIYSRLGIRIPVKHGSRPGIVAQLRHGGHEFVLMGTCGGLPK